MRHKIITGIPTKNASFVMDKVLTILSIFCDKIIILDGKSTDNTKEICLSYDKVRWYEGEYNWLNGEEPIQRNHLINLIKPHNPDYILWVDSDEIPTYNIITFFETIDKNINLWSPFYIQLYKNDNYYRIDKFKTSNGSNLNWDPFTGGRKSSLMKFDFNINYKYDMTVPVGDFHPAPINAPLPHKNTNDFGIFHYRNLDPYYINGEKDEMYAKRDKNIGRGTYEERLLHHKLCRIEGNPVLKEVPEEWKWNILK